MPSLIVYLLQMHMNVETTASPDLTLSLPANQTTSDQPQEISMELDDSAVVQDPEGVSLTKQRHKSFRECPECRKKMFHLPRHLVQLHGWPKEKAAKISCILSIRTVRGMNTTKSLKRRTCTVEGCYAQVRRLGQHLRRVHGKRNISKKFYSKKQSNKENIMKDTRNKEELHEELDESENQNIQELVETDEPNQPVSTSEYWNSIFSTYKNFLKGPAGGSLDERTVIYNTGRLNKLTRELEVENVEEILVEEKLRTYFSGKNKRAGGWTTQTIITYLSTLKRFFSFVAKKRKESPFSELEITEAENMYSILPGWSRSYYKISGEERKIKRQEQQEMLLNKEKINKFYSSKPYRDAIKVIGELDENYLLTKIEFSLVRNALMFMLMLKEEPYFQK